jgi:hypothetical protein
MKTFKLFGLISFAISGLFLSSCTKDTTTTAPTTNINRTVNYTVLVVAGQSSATSSKSAKITTANQMGAQSATVQVSVGGKVISKTTDISGQATFTGLTAGLAAVTVSLANFTTVDYIVNLYQLDSAKYDNINTRVSSTKVVVFPLSGTGMVSVSGHVYMTSDVSVTFPAWATGNTPFVLVNPNNVYAPTSTVIMATIPNTEFKKYVTMIDGGILTDVTYEGISFTGTVDNSGSYSISVPSSAMGLLINIYPPDILTNVIYSAKQFSATTGDVDINPNTQNFILNNKTERYVFSANTSSVKAFTYKNEIVDITYNNPIITDKAYFGFTAYQPPPTK